MIRNFVSYLVWLPFQYVHTIAYRWRYPHGAKGKGGMDGVVNAATIR
jgi:hypothetical protein